jgi:hypothetical protein
MFSFSLASRKLFISSLVSDVTHWSLSNVLFSLQLFVCFLLLFLSLSSSFNALWSDRMHGIISIFLYLWGLLCVLGYDLFWRNFHGLLRRMYIVFLDEMFCRHQLGPIDLWCHLVLGFLCWFFCLDDLVGIKISHYHCVGVYMCF